MNATELRIGNFIMLNNSLREEHLEWQKVNEVRIDSCQLIDNNKETYGQLYKYIDPIPLTEEWLVKFGYLENCIHLSDMKIIQEEEGYYLSDYDDLGVGVSYIKYVHTLQNLYFALTGEELKIKTIEQ